MNSIVTQPATPHRRAPKAIALIGLIALLIASAPSAARAAGTVPVPGAAPTANAGDAVIYVWGEPFGNGGSPITTWYAFCDSSDGGVTASDFSVVSEQVTVTGVTNGKTYTCYERALNSNGLSAATAVSNEVVPGVDDAVPDPPGAPDITPGNGSLSVTFSASNQSNDPIFLYAAICTSDDGGVGRSASSGGLPVVVGAVTKGKTYTCEGQTENTKGVSLLGAESDPVFVPTIAEPPDAVVASANDTTITVAFDPGEDYGDAVSTYHATCTPVLTGVTLHGSGSSSPIEITGGQRGTSYTCQVNATNASGTSYDSWPSDPVQISAIAPAAPAKPTVTLDDTTATVSFVAPDDGGAPISLYTVTCDPVGGGMGASNTGTESPIEIAGLQYGVSYTCKVWATNIIDDGDPSPDSDPVMPTTVPEKVSLAMVRPRDHAVVVDWYAATDNGSPISAYTVSCSSSDGGTSASVVVDGDATEGIATGATNGKTYTCTVYATNGVGDGSVSDESDPVIPIGIPDPPTDVIAHPRDGAIKVTFVPPLNEGGAPITGYTATCYNWDDGSYEQATGPASPITVTGLVNGTMYSCVLYGENSIGVSDVAFTEGVTPDVAQTVPDPPTVDDVTSDAAGQISVMFSEPAFDGRADITDFQVDCDSDDDGVSGSNTGATSPIVVSGLTPGSTYTCVVTATNEIGDSDPSTASDEIAAADTPANDSLPTITGTAVAQRALTADDGDWSGTPAPTLTRQWRRCDKNGANCSDIGGATGPTYVLANADVDHRIRVVVQATNVAGTVTATSAATSVVATVPASLAGAYYYTDALKKASNVVGATAHGATFWGVTSKGNVTNGPKFGTLVGKSLSASIGGIAATVSGKGYWIWLTNGATYAFGDAKGCASPSTRISPKVIALSPTPDGKGCWLTTNSGVVKAFGTAHVYSLVATVKTSQPFVAMLPTSSGHGYWTVTADGHVRRYGDATSFGTAVAAHRTDIVGLLSMGAGYRFATANRQQLTPH
jgi:hypothetical protein